MGSFWGSTYTLQSFMEPLGLSGGGRGDGTRITSDGGDGGSGFSSAMAVALHGAVGGDGYLIVLLLDAAGEES